MTFYFDSLHDFFLMGGKHAFYVWTSFGVAFLAMLVLFLSIYYQNKKVEKNIRRQLQRATTKNNTEDSQ